MDSPTDNSQMLYKLILMKETTQRELSKKSMPYLFNNFSLSLTSMIQDVIKTEI